MNAFSPQELEQYARHFSLPQVGLEGQEKLKKASVLLIGAGGLGSPLGLYLAGAGVGRIGIVDFDVVDRSNLQRQVLYSTADIGQSKAQTAARQLQAINPYITIEAHPTWLDPGTAKKLFPAYDIIVDGTDNFPTRYLVNDACFLLGKPNVYGSIFQFEGQVSVFATPDGPCYRCLHPTPPPPGSIANCAEGGVLGVLPGLVGCMQTIEVLKWLLGIGTSLVGQLLLIDSLEMRVRELQIPRDPDCPLCGQHPSIVEIQQSEEVCHPLPTPQSLIQEITVGELSQILHKEDPPQLLDVREFHEFEICRLPGAVLIPLGSLPDRVTELDPDRDLIVYCKSGVRSADAVSWLNQKGFSRSRNLAGGIMAWQATVDSSLARYW